MQATTKWRIAWATLAGRCANGFERDSGRIVHAVETDVAEDRTGIIAFGPALCGVRPGLRSAGWSSFVGDRKCPKCVRKMKPMSE